MKRLLALLLSSSVIASGYYLPPLTFAIMLLNDTIEEILIHAT